MIRLMFKAPEATSRQTLLIYRINYTMCRLVLQQSKQAQVLVVGQVKVESQIAKYISKCLTVVTLALSFCERGGLQIQAPQP
jgi:hypothetical protein